MEDRETARMRKYGESKTTQIMMATVPHISGVPRNFFGGGVQQIQLRTENREDGDLGAVAT